ncbi:MAG TPA: hypothetical protein VL688_03455 [Verrucomicrobiae bacterium]|nr:hypothetical protein [Verrucomicrobiae bacterium]
MHSKVLKSAAAAAFVLLAVSPAFADDSKNSILQQLLGGFVNSNQNTSNQQGGYSGSAPSNQGAVQDLYQRKARLENSLANDEMLIRQFEEKVSEGKRNGADTSSDEELLARQREAYANDKSDYYALRGQFEQARYSQRQAYQNNPNYYDNGYNQPQQTNPYQIQQDQQSAQAAYQNAARIENSIRNDKMLIRQFQDKIEQGRQSGADTSSDEQLLATQQQALQNDMNDYANAQAQWNAQRNNVRQDYGRPPVLGSSGFGRNSWGSHRRSGWRDDEDERDSWDRNHW